MGLGQSEQVILNTNIKSPSAEMFGADVCDCFCFMSNCVWLQHQNDVKNVRSLALTLLVLLEVL